MTKILTPKPFDNYEISGSKVFDEDNGRNKYFEPVEDSEADCWTLYGHIEGEGVTAIGDFKNARRCRGNLRPDCRRAVQGQLRGESGTEGAECCPEVDGGAQRA